MQPIRTIKSKYVILPIDNIDTDQIIPARYLKVTSRDGLGKAAFADWRYDETGNVKPDFILNQPEAAGAQVLVAGDNFGCGSSREHAPWALVDFGIRAVISTSIADIFKSNALKNGLLPVVVEPELHQKLLQAGGGEVEIDLDACTVRLPDGTSSVFPVDAFSRYLLMNGLDELEFLLNQGDAIAKYEQEHGA